MLALGSATLLQYVKELQLAARLLHVQHKGHKVHGTEARGIPYVHQHLFAASFMMVIFQDVNL